MTQRPDFWNCLLHGDECITNSPPDLDMSFQHAIVIFPHLQVLLPSQPRSQNIHGFVVIRGAGARLCLLVDKL
jgi:hypothetical protein